MTKPTLSSTVNKTSSNQYEFGMWDGESEVWDAMIALAECGALELQNSVSQKTSE